MAISFEGLTAVNAMPLLLPAASSTYETYHDYFSLMKSSITVTAEGDTATEYRFTVETSGDAGLNKLFAMTKCLIRYYPSSTTIPFFDPTARTNSYSTSVPLLEIWVLIGSSGWTSAHPERQLLSHGIRKYYCANITDAALEANLTPLIKGYLPANYIEKEVLARNAAFAGTADQFVSEYFRLFKTDPAMFVLANGGDQICEIDQDVWSTSPTACRLDLYMGTGNDPEFLDWSDDDQIRIFFEYQQRLRYDVWGLFLAGHPMISHILDLPPDSARVDFVDQTNETGVDKYFSNVLALDADIHPNTIIVPTTDVVVRNGQSFPEDSGEVELTIFNPDNAAVNISSSDPSLLSIDGSDSADLSTTNSVTLKAKTAATGEVTLYVKRKADATYATDLLLKELTVKFLTVQVMNINFLKLKDDVHEGVPPDLGDLIEQVNGIVGPQAVVYVASVSVDAANEPLTSDLVIAGNLGDPIAGFTSAAMAATDPNFIKIFDHRDAAQTYNYFFAWDIERYSGDAQETYAITAHIGDGVTLGKDFTVQDKNLRQNAQTMAHEIGHFLAQMTLTDAAGLSTDSGKTQHFAHEVIGNAFVHPSGDHRLTRNLMRMDSQLTGEFKITARQAEIMNDAASQLF